MLRRVQERYGAGAIPVVMFSGKVDEQRAGARGVERRAGLRRQAVRPAAADRPDEADRSRSELTDWLDRHSSAGSSTIGGIRSTDVFVWLTHIGT